MICVYPADCTDFSTNGIGVVTPQTCEVTETLNGEWELSLIHPLDEDGKWQRLTEGRILRAPVPAAMTPRMKLVDLSEGTVIYKVISPNGGKLNLRTGPGKNYKSLGLYRKNTEVIVLDRSNDTWYEVTCPDGKHGYMHTDYLEYVRTDTVLDESTNQVVEPSQLRDQPFRIYRVVPELTGISVYARHIFYDQMDNMIQRYEPSSGDTGAAVALTIPTKCLSENSFTYYSDLESTAEGVAFINVNPVEAIMGDEGFLNKYGAELARDWFDVYLVSRVGEDSAVQIRQGKNLLGVSCDVDISSVATRIMPTGQDEDGKVLYLPELYVDSPNIDAYPAPKWAHLEVSEATESDAKDDKKTVVQCYEEMRKAAKAEFDKGCDLPTVTLKVDFINCANTVEYAQYAALQDIFLGDAVTVIAPRIGLAVSMRMTQYTYDCLQKKYTAMTLGTASETLEGSLISSSQLGNGSITGGKLAFDSVGTGQLQTGSVGAAQIRMAAIQTAHIQTAAITAALIAEAAIQSAHIEDAAITTAKIQDAAIVAAKIAEASITAAHIQKATITSAEIADAAINAAKIALASITSAHIAEAAITSAKIEDLAVTTAKIADAAITHAKIGSAAIKEANIDDAAITRAKIALLAVGEAQIADLAVGNAKIKDAAISTAKIEDLAVTAAKIANATITNAQIANATIGTAQIALGAITTALIEEGAVGTAQIADASITDAKIVELSANRITTGTLSVERLVIVGSEKSIVYTINEANGTTQLSTTTIDGGSLTERSISADRIVAGSITANELAAASILADKIAAGAVTTDKLAANAVTASKIAAGAITTNHVSSDFGATLDLSSNTSVRTTVTQSVDESIAELAVGGVNLVAGSSDQMVSGNSVKNNWLAADELPIDRPYTLSVGEIERISGTAAGITWELVELESGTVHTTGTMEFTSARQTAKFIVPAENGNWALRLYAGIKGATEGNTVRFRKVQLEEGTFATTWKASPEDNAAALGKLTGDLDSLDSSLDSRITALIEAMGLSDKYASAAEFLEAVSQIDLIRSELAQHASDLTLTFNRLAQTEAGITQIFSSFVFGDDGGVPYLDMSASSSSVKMRLTNARLAFVQAGQEVAYFSDHKLYVTRLEVVERISVGTAVNGYLDIVTTDEGVAFVWRS